MNEEIYVEMLENGELYDYITNLQQELEIMVKDDERSQETIIKLSKENERLKKLDENYPIEEELAEAYRREEDYKSRIEKADWWLKEMLKQAKSDETKAIINGTLELLLNGRSDE